MPSRVRVQTTRPNSRVSAPLPLPSCPGETRETSGPAFHPFRLRPKDTLQILQHREPSVPFGRAATVSLLLWLEKGSQTLSFPTCLKWAFTGQAAHERAGFRAQPLALSRKTRVRNSGACHPQAPEASGQMFRGF